MNIMEATKLMITNCESKVLFQIMEKQCFTNPLLFHQFKPTTL